MNISTISRSIFSAITYVPNTIFKGVKSLASRVSSFAGSCFSKIASIFSKSKKVTPLAPSRVTPQAPVTPKVPKASQAPQASQAPVTPKTVSRENTIASLSSTAREDSIASPSSTAREDSIASLSIKERAIFDNLRETRNLTKEQRQDDYLTLLGKAI